MTTYCRLTPDQDDKLQDLVSDFDDAGRELREFLVERMLDWEKELASADDDTPAYITFKARRRLLTIVTWHDALGEVVSINPLELYDVGETRMSDEEAAEAEEDA